MLDITCLQNVALNSQERYDIINAALVAAEDNGFYNEYIFERALYVYAAATLYKDRHDAILEIENINEAFDSLLEDGTLEEMDMNYKDTLNQLSHEAAIWFVDITQYSQSIGGSLADVLSQISGYAANNLAQVFKEAVGDSDIQDILALASEYGINNAPEKTEEPVLQSLFNSAV